MKKTALTALALLTLGLPSFAGPRSLSEAKQIAAAFLNSRAASKAFTSAHLTLASQNMSSEAKMREGNYTPSYYVLNVDGQHGFVIVSGDDRFRDILGYSDTGNFDIDEVPDGLAYWLEALSAEMEANKAYYDANGISRINKAAQMQGGAMEDIEPLLKTHWSQGTPYNQQVPILYDAGDESGYLTKHDGKASTGCVATGTAQVMAKWKYPSKGIGSYTNSKNAQGKFTVNFANETYDWDLIRNNYGSYIAGNGDPNNPRNYQTARFTDEEAAEVAKLCYHVGVAIDAQWNISGNGETAAANSNSIRALVNNFGYNKNAHMVSRDIMSLGAYKALLIEELKAGRPILYSGFSSSGGVGHFFVCDGYQASTSTFHFNWGWAGTFNGYYTLSSLEPGVGGIGAGNGNYTYDQWAGIGVQPELIECEYTPAITFKTGTLTTTSFPRGTYGTIAVDNIRHEDPFFNGEFGCVVCKTDGTVIAENFNKISGFTNGASGSISMYTPYFNSSIPTGKYIIKIAVKSNGKIYILPAHYGNVSSWSANVGENLNGKPGTVTLAPITATPPMIAANAAPAVESEVSTDTIYQEMDATFTIDVKNTGTTDFYDEIGVQLFQGRDFNSGQYFTTVASIPAGQSRKITLSAPVNSEMNTGKYNAVVFYGNNGTIVRTGSNTAVTLVEKSLYPAAIEMTRADAEIPMSVEYYTVSGARIATPSHGIVLRRNIYRGGKVTTDKLYIK